MRQNRTISPKQLTILMVVLVGGPVACGLLLSFLTPRIPEPALPALVRIGSMWIASDEDPTDRRLVPCVTVKNPTKFDWRNLSVGLNEQFYSQEPKGIPAGQQISLPLEVFVARNGSVRFPVGNREIKLVTVFSQIETGARAVSEHSIPKIPISPKKLESEDEGWIPSN